MRFGIGDDQAPTLRAAYTNSDGYAAVGLPAPEQVGQYEYAVALQDIDGNEFSRTGRLFVLQPKVLTIAVDVRAVKKDPAAAADALNRMADWGVQMVYLTERPAAKTDDVQAWLTARHLPAGPVIVWDWNARGNSVSGALPALREQVPSLVLGVGASSDAQDAFSRLGMAAMRIGSWTAFGDRVMSAKELLEPRDFRDTTPDDVMRMLGLSPDEEVPGTPTDLTELETLMAPPAESAQEQQ
jgi:hypothetical protein